MKNQHDFEAEGHSFVITSADTAWDFDLVLKVAAAPLDASPRSRLRGKRQGAATDEAVDYQDRQGGMPLYLNYPFCPSNELCENAD